MPESFMRASIKNPMDNLILVPIDFPVHLIHLKLKFKLAFINPAYLKTMPTSINQITTQKLVFHFQGKT
jgi:hypothetical protein